MFFFCFRGGEGELAVRARRLLFFSSLLGDRERAHMLLSRRDVEYEFGPWEYVCTR